MSKRKHHFFFTGFRHCAPACALIVTSLIIFVLSSPPAWGQGQTYKGSIQKPSAQPPQKPAEKKDVKETPRAETPTPPLPAPAKPAAALGLDFELEMKKLDSLLQLNDKNADAYYNRGWLYEYKGDPEKAAQDYTKAIELDKKLKDAYYNRGLLYARMKKYDEALKDFSEVIKQDPAAVDAYCNRGSVHFQMGKMDLALAEYEAALKISPNDADLYYNRALIYIAKGDKPKGMEDLKKSALMFHDKTRKEFPQLAPQAQPSLKKAALDCQMGEFLNYMPPETKQRVQRFEENRAKLEKAFDEVEKNAKQLFGDKVERQKGAIRFFIEGTDPRWTEVFGPKWPEIIKQNPKDPRYFMLSLEYSWKEECHILQRLQACLENPAYCEETAIENSALKMKRIDGTWKLVDSKTPQEWTQVLLMGEGILQVMQWANKHLTESKGKVTYEEAILALAKGYTARLMDLSNRVKAAK
jgi:tetratricopeptide (TPR) repeat protein